MKRLFKNKLSINALSAATQVGFTAIIYFLIYKYQIKILGIELVGFWSLLVSISAMVSIANLGLNAGIVKITAEKLVTNDTQSIGSYIYTTTISQLGFFSTIAITILFSGKYLLQYLVNSHTLTLGLNLLPSILGIAILSNISFIYTSVLEGLQKNYLKDLTATISNIIGLIFTFILLPKYKLMGLVYAQLIQYTVCLIVAICFVYFNSNFLVLRYWKFSFAKLKQLINYGYKFQITSVGQLLIEPITKSLLTKFGGLSQLGFFDLAYRITLQIRTLISTTNQIVVPIIATQNIKNTIDAKIEFFKKMCHSLYSFALVLISILIVSTPFISYFFFEKYQLNFIFFTYLLSLFTGFYILMLPSYFSALADAKLRILIVGFGLYVLLSIILGYFGGWLANTTGVLVSQIISIIVCSAVITYKYVSGLNIHIKSIFSKSQLYLLIILLVSFLVSLLLKNFSFQMQNLALSTLLLVLLGIVISFIILKKSLITTFKNLYN